MTLEEFQNELRQGIPNPLPEPQPYDPTVNHAPTPFVILTRRTMQCWLPSLQRS